MAVSALTARRRVTLGLLATALPLLALIALCFGTVAISTGQLWQFLLGGEEAGWMRSIVIDIRLPRVLLAVVIGGGLALAGAAMQGLFRNPLADPGLLGVSMGAALAAVLVIVFGGSLLDQLASNWRPWLLPMAAFFGGLIAMLLVYAAAAKVGQDHVAAMLLAGIALNALAGSGIGLLSYLAQAEQLRLITFWSMGSLARADWQTLGIAALLIGAAGLLLIREAKALNVLALGEEAASHLGVRVPALQRRLVLLVAVVVGAAVAFSGVIAFVGLLVPHVLRLLLGPDHRYLLPGSAMLGAIVLLIADAFTRSVLAPAELPLGILAGLFGGPFFFWLLLRFRRGYGV